MLSKESMSFPSIFPIHLLVFSFCLTVFLPSQTSAPFEGKARFENMQKAFRLAESNGYVGFQGDIEKNNFLIPVSINYKKTKFILDTGCTTTLVNFHYLNKWNIDPPVLSEKQKGETYLGGTLVGQQVILPLVDFPVFQIRNMKAYASKVSFPLAQGLLGADFLRSNAAIIYFYSSGVQIHPQGKSAANFSSFLKSAGYTAIPVHWNGGCFSVPISYHQIQGEAFIDTGGAFTIIDQTFAEKVDVKSRHTHLGVKDLANKTASLKAIKLNEIKIGNFSNQKMEVGVVSRKETKDNAQSHLEKYAAVIGMELLYQNNAIWDFGSSILYLHP